MDITWDLFPKCLSTSQGFHSHSRCALRSPAPAPKRRNSLPDEVHGGFWKYQRRVAVAYVTLGSLGLGWKAWHETSNIIKPSHKERVKVNVGTTDMVYSYHPARIMRGSLLQMTEIDYTGQKTCEVVVGDPSRLNRWLETCWNDPPLGALGDRGTHGAKLQLGLYPSCQADGLYQKKGEKAMGP